MGIGAQSHLRGHICWRSHVGTRAQQARGVLQAPGPLPGTAQRSARGRSRLGTAVRQRRSAKAAREGNISTWSSSTGLGKTGT